jgi:hypothetical protein
MADYLVYWKVFWDEARNLNQEGYDWHTNDADFYNQVCSGDRLWVVVSGGSKYQNEWRLIQLIVVFDRERLRTEFGDYHIIGDEARSFFFDIYSQADFTPILKKLNFASGKKIINDGREIGFAIQRIRRMAVEDAHLLERYAQRLNVVTVGNIIPDLIARESDFRKQIWTSLLERADPYKATPELLRELGIYGGAQGVWVDKARTSKLTEDGTGITVGLLHTGSSYADDISDDAVLYHYPKTNRPSARDKSEVDATKAAGRLRLPVFVIEYPTPNSKVREVHLGWVEDWDDEAGIFLISFGEVQQVTPHHEEDELSFEPFATLQQRKRLVNVRKGQQQFKFEVIKRYGARCAVCGIGFLELLDGAHIIPNKAAGSYDARNGLVLCASHHRAFDAGLFTIEPDTLRIHLAPIVQDARRLGITFTTLEHLPRKPHTQAIEWHWKQWKQRYPLLR